MHTDSLGNTNSILDNNLALEQVEGSIECSSAAGTGFGRDPMPGYHKHCICLPSDPNDQPSDDDDTPPIMDGAYDGPNECETGFVLVDGTCVPSSDAPDVSNADMVLTMDSTATNPNAYDQAAMEAEISNLVIDSATGLTKVQIVSVTMDTMGDGDGERSGRLRRVADNATSVHGPDAHKMFSSAHMKAMFSEAKGTVFAGIDAMKDMGVAAVNKRRQAIELASADGRFKPSAMATSLTGEAVPPLLKSIVAEYAVPTEVNTVTLSYGLGMRTRAAELARVADFVRTGVQATFPTMSASDFTVSHSRSGNGMIRFSVRFREGLESFTELHRVSIAESVWRGRFSLTPAAVLGPDTNFRVAKVPVDMITTITQANTIQVTYMMGGNALPRQLKQVASKLSFEMDAAFDDLEAKDFIIQHQLSDNAAIYSIILDDEKIGSIDDRRDWLQGHLANSGYVPQGRTPDGVVYDVPAKSIETAWVANTITIKYGMKVASTTQEQLLAFADEIRHDMLATFSDLRSTNDFSVFYRVSDSGSVKFSIMLKHGSVGDIATRRATIISAVNRGGFAPAVSPGGQFSATKVAPQSVTTGSAATTVTLTYGFTMPGSDVVSTATGAVLPPSDQLAAVTAHIREEVLGIFADIGAIDFDVAFVPGAGMTTDCHVTFNSHQVGNLAYRRAVITNAYLSGGFQATIVTSSGFKQYRVQSIASPPAQNIVAIRYFVQGSPSSETLARLESEVKSDVLSIFADVGADDVKVTYQVEAGGVAKVSVQFLVEKDTTTIRTTTTTTVTSTQQTRTARFVVKLDPSISLDQASAYAAEVQEALGGIGVYLNVSGTQVMVRLQTAQVEIPQHRAASPTPTYVYLRSAVLLPAARHAYAFP